MNTEGLLHTQEVTGSSPVAPTINLSAFSEWFGPAGLQYPLEILLSEQQALSKQATNEPRGHPPEGHPHRQRVPEGSSVTTSVRTMLVVLLVARGRPRGAHSPGACSLGAAHHGPECPDCPDFDSSKEGNL